MYVSPCLEDRLQVLEAACGDPEKLAPAFAAVDIDGRAMHCGKHFIGNRGRSGDAEKLAAVTECHGECPGMN